MQSGEDELIARYFKPIATHPGALALRDDTALLSLPERQQLVLTCDAIVAGIHFFPDDPADTVARKALRVNLSDLAAKGAHPVGCLMTLALPESTGEDWLKAFAAGLQSDCALYACPLLGGDTVRTGGPLSVSIFAIGALPNGGMVQRVGARPGDRLFVTGSIGDAALGLHLLHEPHHVAAWSLSEEEASHLIGRYRVPQPRSVLADALRGCASAAMDISDGLAGDLGKLCAASAVSARIDAARIPLSVAAQRALRAQPGLIERIATGGDDYEILAAVPVEQAQVFQQGAGKAGVAVAEIGEVVAGDAAPQIIGPDGTPLRFARASFSHF